MSPARLFTLLLFVLLCDDATAQEKITRYGAIMDQDLLAETFGIKEANEDRNYTMGLGLFLSNNIWADKKIFSPLAYASHKLESGFGKRLFGDGEKAKSVTMSFGMTGFTPRYLGDNLADSLYHLEQDRPFASILFL